MLAPQSLSPGLHMNTVVARLAIFASSVSAADDGELLVRASAVLKSQGPRAQETGSVGDPPPSGRVQTRALSGAHHAGRKPVENPLVGWRHMTPSTGPGCVWYSFLIANGGRDLSQYTKIAFLLFERVCPCSQDESKPPGSWQRNRPHARRLLWFLFSILTCSSRQRHRARFAHWETIGVAWVRKGVRWCHEATPPDHLPPVLRS